MTFGLVLLTYNEIDGISYLWDKIPFSVFNEFFAVDGGSTDGTLEFFHQKGCKIVGQSKKGRGEAFRIAFANSESDILIFYSPDGNEDPVDILKIKSTFEQNQEAQIVIASRMMKNSYNEEDDKFFRWRKWANNFFNFIANLFFNRKMFSNYITDTINGFRGIRRTAFEIIKPDADGYTIEYQSTIRAFKKKLPVIEFPTVEKQRIGGESYAKSFPTGIRFINCFLLELFRKQE